MAEYGKIRSGIAGMDEMFDGLRFGDNVVWQMEEPEEFMPFARLFVKQCLQDQRRVVYVRFAGHAPLLEDMEGVTVFRAALDHKFENFTVNLYQMIRDEAPRTVYLFDSLSSLQTAWSTDLMMGNFFSLIGPLITRKESAAYYPVLRGRHSFEAIAKIRDTTQIFLDLYSDEECCYLRPMKVWQRYSPTMFLPHVYEKHTGRFSLATEGVQVSHFYQLMNETVAGSMEQSEDSWDRFFRETQMRRQAGEDVSEACRKMCRMMITRDEYLRDLVIEHFTPEDYFEVRSRMVGTGMIGGKACGMLLARKIIENRCPEVFRRLEPHDSFYIGFDVYYSYIVENDFWEMRVKQRQEENYFSMAPELAAALKRGKFSRSLEDQFRRLLDYYGQDPFIVRSSSILEDGFGNAFAGKYESVFCANSGSPEENLREFEDAVRTVYASTLSMGALEYRKRRGLEKRDEQMSLLVQRVSGSRLAHLFLPAAAGVGYSLSPYKFGTSDEEDMGMLRLVAGLGTAAVDRMQGSYPRLVSMDSPERQVLATAAERHQFSQRKIDVINTGSGQFESLDLGDVEGVLPYYLKRQLLTHDTESERYFYDLGERRDVYFVSCDGIVKNKDMMEDFRQILHTLQDAYRYPVDIEFTVNLSKKGEYVINLLQCRPLQVAKDYEVITLPTGVPEEKIFLECRNASMGLSRELKMDYIVLIDGIGYYRMPYRDKYEVARALGAVNWALREQNQNLMLFAPGRICTSSPELGVPSSFAEISEFNVICEMSETGAGYMPELSYGSHIFQDLVEAGILYTAVNDNNRTQIFRPECLQHLPNLLLQMYPQGESLQEIVKVYKVTDENCRLYYSMPEGHLICTIGT